MTDDIVQPTPEGAPESGPLFLSPGSLLAEPAQDPSPVSPSPAVDPYGDFEVTLPEGYEIEPVIMDEFKQVARSLNLTREQAQNLVSLQSKLTEQTAQTQAQIYAQGIQKWAEVARADREIGGVEFDRNVAVARKAIQTFGSRDLIDFVNTSGVGNHPELIRMLVRVGKAMGEDGRVSAGGASPSADAALRSLYPTMYKGT